MQAYIGTKIVQAEPQTDSEAHGAEVNKKSLLGYKVVYEDGYISWSPKSVFERCYRQVTHREAVIVMRLQSGLYVEDDVPTWEQLEITPKNKNAKKRGKA